MRKLILQPPRTCNCFHLVLAKFCIFDTCDFLRFPPAIGKGKSHRKGWDCIVLYRSGEERREKTGQMVTLKWRYHFVNGSELIRAFS